MRRLAVLILTGCLAGSLLLGAASAAMRFRTEMIRVYYRTDPPLRLFVNGRETEPAVDPFLIDPGWIMVPVEFLANELGARVTWDDATSTLNIFTAQTAPVPPAEPPAQPPPAPPPVSSAAPEIALLEFLRANYSSVTVGGQELRFVFDEVDLGWEVAGRTRVLVSARIDEDYYLNWLDLLIKQQDAQCRQFVETVARKCIEYLPKCDLYLSIMYQERYSFYPSGYDLDDISYYPGSDKPWLVTKTIASALYLDDRLSVTIK